MTAPDNRATPDPHPPELGALGPEEAIEGLAATLHLLLGWCVGAAVSAPQRASAAWHELRPHRRRVARCLEALGLPTLSSPYGLDDDPYGYDPAVDVLVKSAELAVHETNARTPSAARDAGHTYIKCLRCGMQSYHPRDVAERYCGWCHDWHAPHGDPSTYELGITTPRDVR